MALNADFVQCAEFSFLACPIKNCNRMHPAYCIAPRSGSVPEDELAATARSEALTQQLSDEAHKSVVPQIILVLGLKGAGAWPLT